MRPSWTAPSDRASPTAKVTDTGGPSTPQATSGAGRGLIGGRDRDGVCHAIASDPVSSDQSTCRGPADRNRVERSGTDNYGNSPQKGGPSQPPGSHQQALRFPRSPVRCAADDLVGVAQTEDRAWIRAALGELVPLRDSARFAVSRSTATGSASSSSRVSPRNASSRLVITEAGRPRPATRRSARLCPHGTDRR
jgi:hypothetical protein